MYTVLMVAAMAVGSGDSRDGAMDDRTVQVVPLERVLRTGMLKDDVWELLDPKQGLPLQVIVYHDLQGGNNYHVEKHFELRRGLDGKRRYPPVALFFDDDGCLRDWKILPPNSRYILPAPQISGANPR